MSLSAFAQETKKLTACASHTPPFVLMKDGVGTSGYSVEYFANVAKRIERVGVIYELPWARCLREVASGKVDLAVDAYDDAARRITYQYSAPYYTLTPQVFFKPSASVGSILAKSAAELAARSGCGVHEYTYEHYGLDANRIDRGAKSDKQMFMMLLAGRCEYAVEELEYIIGARKAEGDWPDESALKSYRPDWAKAPQLHYLVSRGHPHAQELIKGINKSIGDIERTGEASALRVKYFPEIDSRRMRH